MIYLAAVKINNELYFGESHAEILKNYYNNYFLLNPTEEHRISMIKGVQGFVTDEGEFLNREEALAHVKSCGQHYYPRDYTGNLLFSEHICMKKGAL